MRILLAAAFLATLPSWAGAQMSVQEYPLPPRITAHDVWADPAPEKWDSYGSSSGSANVRQIHGRKGEVWTPESASGKLVVYRYR